MFPDFELVLDLANNALELHRLDKYGERLAKDDYFPQYDLSLPVYNYTDVLFVEARISNKRYTFCLDTGAESNVLHSFLPDKILNTVSITRRSSLSGAGKQRVEAFYGVMNDFSIGGIQMPGMQTLVTNLNHMSEAFGLHVDGMLGCDFFEKGIIDINMKLNRLGIVFYQKQSE